jgi:hypothetical protein
MKKLTTSEEIAVWSQLRSSMNSWVSVTATLLTGGTALFFVAFGVILANAETIGEGMTLLLTLGLFFGSLFLLISILHITHATSHITEACMSIESSLFGKEENIHKITIIANRHPVWGHGSPLGEYFKYWAFSIAIAVALLTIWRFLLWTGALTN